ncbi:MAG: hypothetical protein AB2784_16840 [Candidatus Thiodiazotropha endolucinida]
MEKNLFKDARYLRILSEIKGTAPPGPSSASPAGYQDDWLPIKTAPTTGRQKILLKTPYSPSGELAYSNTWWTAGFSVECKPTHWKPA